MLRVCRLVGFRHTLVIRHRLITSKSPLDPVRDSDIFLCTLVAHHVTIHCSQLAIHRPSMIGMTVWLCCSLPDFVSMPSD